MSDRKAGRLGSFIPRVSRWLAWITATSVVGSVASWCEVSTDFERGTGIALLCHYHDESPRSTAREIDRWVKQPCWAVYRSARGNIGLASYDIHLKRHTNERGFFLWRRRGSGWVEIHRSTSEPKRLTPYPTFTPRRS
jgi:hypothetical protein